MGYASRRDTADLNQLPHVHLTCELRKWIRVDQEYRAQKMALPLQHYLISVRGSDKSISQMLLISPISSRALPDSATNKTSTLESCANLNPPADQVLHIFFEFLLRAFS